MLKPPVHAFVEISGRSHWPRVLKLSLPCGHVYARVRIPPKALGRPMSSCFRLALNLLAWDGPRLADMPIEKETREQHQKRRNDESAKAMEWLASHWTQPRNCPICGGLQWGVGQALELREFNSGDIVIGGDSQVTPITAVVCQTCGYTFFMNAIISGAVPSEPNHTEQGKGKS